MRPLQLFISSSGNSRHAFIDRLKARNDIPLPLAESITGHGRNVSDFATYGSVGYTLEQKAEVIEKILL